MRKIDQLRFVGTNSEITTMGFWNKIFHYLCTVYTFKQYIMATKTKMVAKTTSKPKLTDKDKAAGKAKAAAAKSKTASGVNALIGKNDPTGRPYTKDTAKKKLAYDDYKKKTTSPR